MCLGGLPVAVPQTKRNNVFLHGQADQLFRAFAFPDNHITVITNWEGVLQGGPASNSRARAMRVENLGPEGKLLVQMTQKPLHSTLDLARTRALGGETLDLARTRVWTRKTLIEVSMACNFLGLQRSAKPEDAFQA